MTIKEKKDRGKSDWKKSWSEKEKEDQCVDKDLSVFTVETFFEKVVPFVICTLIPSLLLMLTIIIMF